MFFINYDKNNKMVIGLKFLFLFKASSEILLCFFKLTASLWGFLGGKVQISLFNVSIKKIANVKYVF